jgi:DNA-3-methyladenine glycosylase
MRENRKTNPVKELNWLLEDTVTAARRLLGMRLRTGNIEIRITETEAYTDNDPASHAVTRPHAAGAIMNTAGLIYVYQVYGIHYCMNITTDSQKPGAVLIRAGEPLAGVETMKKRRGKERLELLTVGPGRLCQALDVNLSCSGTPVGQRIELLPGVAAKNIVTATRIGISKGKELRYRFFDGDSRFHHP